IYESILYQPVALPEAAAAYCKGVICRMVHPITALGILMFGVVAIGVTNIACILVRHQAIIPIKHRLKIEKRSTYVVFLVMLTLIFAIPIPAFMAFTTSNEEMDRLIYESYFEISWIRERGAYFKFPDSLALYVIVSMAVVFLLGYIFISIIPFWHMFYVLNQTNAYIHSKIAIRQSLLRLFVQLIVPFLFITAPLTIILFQYLFRSFPFMVGVFAILIIPLHPIVHNIVLLFLMPTYRRVIARVIGRLRKQSNTSTHKISC
ncbi:sri-33, partial [Pristionchus pacificus]